MAVACRRGLARPKAADKWATITRAALSSDEEEERILWERRSSPVDSRETRARSKLAINSG